MADALDWFRAGQQITDNRRRLAQNAKIAESAVRVNPELLMRMSGMDYDEGGKPDPDLIKSLSDSFSTMSAEDKVARYAGAVAGLHEEAQAKQARALTGLNRARMEAMAQDDSEDQAVGKAINRFTQTEQEMPAGVQGPPQAYGYDDRVRNALGTPGLGGRGATKMLEIMERFAPKAEKPEFSPEDYMQLPGGLIANRKTGAMHALPKPGDNDDDQPRYPWETRPEDEFLKGLQNLIDKPKEYDHAVKRRVEFKKTQPKEIDPQTMLMFAAMAKDPGPAGELARQFLRQHGAGSDSDTAGNGSTKGGPSYDDFLGWRKQRK